MNLKTLTGPSIQAALAEARHLLGDDVLLLESVAARGEEPARVTVMVDEALADAPRETVHAEAAAPVEAAAVAAPAPPGYGYAAQTPRVPMTGGEGSAAAPAGLSASPAAPARPRLFDPAPEPPSTDGLEALLDTRLGGLLDRLDKLEAGSSERHRLAHPLYADLLDRGLRPDTADRLLGAVAERGFRLDGRGAEAISELRWAILQELRERLPRAARPDATGTLMLVGPSGAGKTSLLLKLALHPSVYGRRKTAALVLTQEDDDAHQNPTDLYRRHGLPVQTASTPEEVRRALIRTTEFDRLLIDTPPLHPNPRTARATAAWLEGLLAEIDAFDVHLVLDATRALGGFDPSALRRLHPTAAALTRLDETERWGHVAEWMLALGLPVRFVSTGPGIPDGVRTFSPSWFVEEVARSGDEDGGLFAWS